MIGKCAVCGKATDVLAACSACGGISFAYCNECLSKGLEPYDALVGMGMCVDEISKDFRDQILLPSLKLHGKTLEEFDTDVNKMYDRYYDWLQHQDECVAYECEAEQF